jgi:hypothetical protein
VTAKRLIVQADDFGMWHAVNLGIVETFQSGIVTQMSAMAPCPWISEAPPSRGSSKYRLVRTARSPVNGTTCAGDP